MLEIVAAYLFMSTSALIIAASFKFMGWLNRVLT